MDWFLFALLTVFANSFANIFRKIVMKDDKSDAMASGIIFQFLGGILIAIVAIAHGFVWPPIDKYFINFFFVGIFWAAATWMQFKAYQHMEASEAIIVSTLQAIVVIFCANIFLREVFTLQMAFGTLLVLAGVIYISYASKKISFNKGLMYALGFCLFSGLGVVNDTYMVKSVEPFSYLTIGFIIPGIFLFIARPQALSHIKKMMHITQFKKIFLLTFFYVLSAIFFVYAILSGAQVSQLSPISESTVIVTVLLATIFLGERDHLLKKCISTILVFIGVLLLR